MKRRKKSGVQLFGIFTERKEGGKKRKRARPDGSYRIAGSKRGLSFYADLLFSAAVGLLLLLRTKKILLRSYSIYIYVCM